MVASPSVRKMTRGTRWDERCLEEDGGLMSWAAESRAALILVPKAEETHTIHTMTHAQKNKCPDTKAQLASVPLL